MEENKRTELDKINEKKEIMTPKDYRSIFWRSFTIQGSWSFDKMMAYGYMYAIEKPLRKIYPNDDDFYAALKRHTETFNVTPHVSPFLMTLGVAMEEENAKSDTFDTSSINNVKVGLMGPMSGIGDSFFWGTFRVIAAGIGIGLAKSGNILGAVIYFLLYTAIHFITKILGGKYGYKMGTKFLENSEENHLMDKLSMGASILGMTVIGAMIMAFGISLFLLPNQLSTGGISGISTILYYSCNYPVGLTMLLINVPLFVIAMVKVNKR